MSSFCNFNIWLLYHSYLLKNHSKLCVYKKRLLSKLRVYWTTIVTRCTSSLFLLFLFSSKMTSVKGQGLTSWPFMTRILYQPRYYNKITKVNTKKNLFLANYFRAQNGDDVNSLDQMPFIMPQPVEKCCVSFLDKGYTRGRSFSAIFNHDVSEFWEGDVMGL